MEKDIRHSYNIVRIRRILNGKRYGFQKGHTLGFQKGNTLGLEHRFKKGHTIGVRFQKGNTFGFQKGHTFGVRFQKTHGLISTGTYRTWVSMGGRCKNMLDKYYGGKGIKVCERWSSFVCFLEDMGHRPEGMTIDRKDSNGNYEPGNCRWATPAEQRANQTPRKKRAVPIVREDDDVLECEGRA